MSNLKHYSSYQVKYKLVYNDGTFYCTSHYRRSTWKDHSSRVEAMLCRTRWVRLRGPLCSFDPPLLASVKILLLTPTQVFAAKWVDHLDSALGIGPCGKGQTLQQYDREESVLHGQNWNYADAQQGGAKPSHRRGNLQQCRESRQLFCAGVRLGFKRRSGRWSNKYCHGSKITIKSE